MTDQRNERRLEHQLAQADREHDRLLSCIEILLNRAVFLERENRRLTEEVTTLRGKAAWHTTI